MVHTTNLSKLKTILQADAPFAVTASSNSLEHMTILQDVHPCQCCICSVHGLHYLVFSRMSIQDFAHQLQAPVSRRMQVISRMGHWVYQALYRSYLLFFKPAGLLAAGDWPGAATNDYSLFWHERFLMTVPEELVNLLFPFLVRLDKVGQEVTCMLMLMLRSYTPNDNADLHMPQIFLRVYAWDEHAPVSFGLQKIDKLS